jgi:hypothetical protein
MLKTNRVQRVDAGDMSALVAAVKKQMGNPEQSLSKDASKLLDGRNGCSGYSADGTSQPATMTGNGIVISEL